MPRLAAYFGGRSMAKLERINAAVNAFMWGPAMLVLFMFVGIYLSIKTGFVQLKTRTIYNKTIRTLLMHRENKNNAALTPFQAMTSALAGTVGTGNIAGVALAVLYGGAGTVFWMWISAFLGMCTKYAEILLAMRYRHRLSDGGYHGGAMYYIEYGLGRRMRPLAVAFALFGCGASFGIGNVAQGTEIAGAAQELLGAPREITGLCLALVVGITIIGGIKRVGAVTGVLVPTMSVLYLLMGVYIIIVRVQGVPAMLAEIFTEAFSPRAMGGGIINAIRLGVSRGVFSNEAGLGSAPMAHATAETDEPCEQAMWGILEVFVDTMVICSVTAFALLLSGICEADNTARYESGTAATAAAFDAILHNGYGGILIKLSVILFAVSSMVCWSYYGECCVAYLTRDSRIAVHIYKVIFTAVCFAGAVGTGTMMWSVSDTLNALMAVPNLSAIMLLSGAVTTMTRGYFEKNKANGKNTVADTGE